MRKLPVVENPVVEATVRVVSPEAIAADSVVWGLLAYISKCSLSSYRPSKASHIQEWCPSVALRKQASLLELGT